jgi:hypothetical protein
MTSDFADRAAKPKPSFFFHLGDVIYNFGEARYYYDQFYEPYRNYPAPILAVAGNHDGMVAPGSTVKTLDAFLTNFCANGFYSVPDAGGLSRTAQIQPGVYFTFEAPFVRIFALYSNALENPGAIASAQVGDAQLRFLEAALTRVKEEKFSGALIIAIHHDPYSPGGHAGSPRMLLDLDAVSRRTGVWPHAVLSGHAHNYQRYTRIQVERETPLAVAFERETPFVVAGAGGNGIARLARSGELPPHPPTTIQSNDTEPVLFENYDDQDFGYLRVTVNAIQLRIEYQPVSGGPPRDSVTVDLATRKLVPFHSR